MGGNHEGAVRSAVDAFNAGDIDGYLEAFAPDGLRWVGGIETPMTMADISDNLREMAQAFDGLHLREDLLIAGGDHVCACWTLVGTHTGRYAGIDASHRAIKVELCEVYSFDRAAITTTRVYGESMSLFTQIGVL